VLLLIPILNALKPERKQQMKLMVSYNIKVFSAVLHKETTIYSVKVNLNGPNVDHMSAILKTLCHHLNHGNVVTFHF
jgi:hypothetical protein